MPQQDNSTDQLFGKAIGFIIATGIVGIFFALKKLVQKHVLLALLPTVLIAVFLPTAGPGTQPLLFLLLLGSMVFTVWKLIQGRYQYGKKKELDLDGFYFGYIGKQPMGRGRCQDGHILVVGGAGSGKSACLAIPTLRYFWKGNFLAVDIKGELREKGLRAGLRFNPSNPGTLGYDPFYALKNSSDIGSDIRGIALTMVPLPPDLKDPFWVRNSQIILTGHLLYCYRQGLSFLEALQLLQKTPIRVLLNIDGEDPDVAMLLGQFAGTKEETLGGIMAELSTHVLPFLLDKDIERALSKPVEETITPDKLEQGLDIFLQIPEHKLNQWKALITLILQQFLTHFERRGEGNHEPILFLVDEFPRFGKIEAMLSGLATLRSKKITICLIAQSLAQLDSIYGADQRKVIADNCSYKAVLSATDADTQKYFSALVGTELQAQQSTTRDEKEASFFFGKKVVSSTVTMVEKAVIKPEQLAYLGREKKLLWLTPMGHLLLDKQRYDQITGEEPIITTYPGLKAEFDSIPDGMPEGTATVEPAATDGKAESLTGIQAGTQKPERVQEPVQWGNMLAGSFRNRVMLEAATPFLFSLLAWHINFFPLSDMIPVYAQIPTYFHLIPPHIGKFNVNNFYSSAVVLCFGFLLFWLYRRGGYSVKTLVQAATPFAISFTFLSGGLGFYDPLGLRRAPLEALEAAKPYFALTVLCFGFMLFWLVYQGRNIALPKEAHNPENSINRSLLLSWQRVFLQAITPLALVSLFWFPHIVDDYTLIFKEPLISLFSNHYTIAMVVSFGAMLFWLYYRGYSVKIKTAVQATTPFIWAFTLFCYIHAAPYDIKEVWISSVITLVLGSFWFMLFWLFYRGRDLAPPKSPIGAKESKSPVL